MPKRILLKFSVLLLSLALSFIPTSHGFSLPEPSEVVSGEVSFSYPDSSTLQIDATDKAIVNYSSFDIKNNEYVIINLPSSDAEFLNRVTGDKYSKIFGSLTCNGIFILVNPNGIVFGPNANIDVGGLIASTRDITNADFLASRYVFNKLSRDQLDTLLINKGSITIRNGGFGVFIAGAIENEGVITANLGTIAMAAGDMVTLSLSGNELISIAIDQPTASQIYDLDGNPITEQIRNTGTLQADGGTILLKAEALPGIFEKAINLEGYVRADRLENKDGVIRIVSSGKVEITGEVSASGSISIEAGEISAKVIAPNTEFFKTSGNIEIMASSLLEDLITLEGEGFNVTYLKTTNLTLQSNNAINTSPGVIISASQLKVIAKQFGSIEVPLVLDAGLTYIKRILGDIEIMESLGLGSTVMLRGPPSGFGAVTYNQDTQLTLEAENVVFKGNFTLFSDLVIEGNLKVLSGEIRGSGSKGSPIITVKKDLIFSGTGYTYFGYRDLLGDGDYRFTVNLEGNLTLDNPNAWVYSDINFTGTQDQTISYTQGTVYGSLKVNKPSGALNYGELDLSQLPLYFVENQGQIPSSEVKFYIYLGNSLVYFTPQYVLYSFNQIDAAGALQRQYIWLNFAGANLNPDIIPEFTSGTIFNYFKGSDPGLWQTNIPTYYKIIYNELYPGINLIYSSKEGQLETEFLILAGADYQNIQLSYTGIEGLEIDAQGNLIIKTSLGELLEAKPYAYQQINGLTQEILAEYTLLSNNTYGYKVTGYNPNYPLIIDPTLAYSTFLGGSSNDRGYAIAVDSSGNVYVTGETWDDTTDFPTTVGAYDTTHNADLDVFVAKLNATGNSLTWSTFLGGGSTDRGYAIAVDSSGNVYVTGMAQSGFPTTAGVYDTTQNGSDDVFVAKLNSDGTSLTYSTFIGGSSFDRGYAIAVDSSGNVYVTGETFDSTTDFPTTASVYDTTHNGNYDVFLAKLNSDATSLTYSTFIGGSGNDRGTSIAVDSSGNVYIGGWTADAATDFPTTTGVYDTTQNGSDDVFVAKLNSDGTSLTYSTFIGGSGEDRVYSMAVDSSGNVYVTGTTADDVTDFPTTTGVYDTTQNGGSYDVFVAKLNSDATSLTYSTFLGGSGDDRGYAIAVDSSGNAYIGGWANSGFPTTAGAYDTSFNSGSYDGFFSVLNSGASSLTYSTFLGGSGDDRGYAIAVDSSGNVYLTGQTADDTTDFPTTASVYDTTNNGLDDVFVAKFGFNFSWDGSTDTDWATAANWDLNDVPASIDNVIIDNVTNDPLLDSARTVNNLTINAGGVLDLNGNNLTLNGTFTNNGTLKLVGSETLTTFTNDTNSGTIQYAGTGTYSSLVAGNNYYHLTFSNTGTYSLNAALTVNGNLTLSHASGTLDLNGNNLTLASDSAFSNEGTLKLTGAETLTNLTHDTNSGTVNYYGSGTATISGSNTFYNFTCTTAGKQLTFTAGTTQTIKGALTLTGASGNLILLRSSSDGSQWSIDPQGTRSVSYVDVEYSNNIHATRIDPANSNNSGNNTNWFAATAGLSPSDIEDTVKIIYIIRFEAKKENIIIQKEKEGLFPSIVSLSEGKEAVSKEEKYEEGERKIRKPAKK